MKKKRREQRRLLLGPWPTSKDTLARLEDYQKKLMARGMTRAEKWGYECLKKSGIKFKRERRWGYRIFDFWSSVYGIAVEIDGQEHRENWDKKRDKQDFLRSGVIVLRVNNFDEHGMSELLKSLTFLKYETWIERRARMGLLTKIQKAKFYGRTNPCVE